MIKVCIFNKINDVSRFDIFKRFFECINSKIYLTCCTKTGAVYQNVFDGERRMVTAGIYRSRRLSVGSEAESMATRNWKRSRTAQTIAENVFFSVKLSRACEFRFILKTVRREAVMLIEAKLPRTRPRTRTKPRGRGRGRGQNHEAEDKAEDIFFSLRRYSYSK